VKCFEDFKKYEGILTNVKREITGSTVIVERIATFSL